MAQIFSQRRRRSIRRALCTVVVAVSVLSAGASQISASASTLSRRRSATATVAFQHRPNSSFTLSNRGFQSRQRSLHSSSTALFSNSDDPQNQSSFLSTSKANVSFKSNKNNNNNAPSNLSPVDQLLLTLTSDRTSLLLGSVGILLLLLNRLVSFPEDADFEASRSRIDLLGVFAAGSVLLNGITKLDVESVRAEQVALEGVNEEKVAWIEENQNKVMIGNDQSSFQSTVEWALSSFLKCSPARTAVLLASNPTENQRWMPLATVGVLPLDAQLRSAIPVANTPILDRMLREDGNIKGGSVGGTEVIGATVRKGPKESYLPTLQALPGRVEFTYLPSNAQEVLILPVPRPEGDDTKNNDGWYFAVVLGGDTAKSFAPRDIAWCKEIASWIGECVQRD